MGRERFFPLMTTMMMMMLVLPYFLGCFLVVEAFSVVVSPSTTTSRSIFGSYKLASSSPSSTTSASHTSLHATNKNKASHLEELKIIFSDVDGALIHYPKTKKDDDDDSDDDSITTTMQQAATDEILALPPSATGMKGIISSQTLKTCSDLRKRGVKVVLVSGMRTSTLLNRLPYLPRADAYCTEAGGRIFYPTQVSSSSSSSMMDDDNDDDDSTTNDTASGDESEHEWTSVTFRGAGPDDLQPFGLREDMIWKERMELDNAAGKDGYAGNEVFSNRLCDGDDDDDEECMIDYENPYGFPKQKDVIPISQRKGMLWDFARQLQDKYNFVLDTKSYSTCFRVNKKHQTNDKFHALLKGDIVHPEDQIGKSTNLGCIDFYPISSGKANCCQYIANSLNIDLAKESVCICDDDNDIEMALACAHAYIPALTSESMIEIIQNNPDKFTQTYQQGRVEETMATDLALQLINDECP